MNQDEGSCQLSHTYDSFIDMMAGHRVKIQKNRFFLKAVKMSKFSSFISVVQYEFV